jgi:hypothetical protein
VQLNGHFTGEAGGELFNGSGKTDIIVRHDDRNVFIGECKIWAGVAKFVSALDQLEVTWFGATLRRRSYSSSSKRIQLQSYPRRGMRSVHMRGSWC